MTPRKEVAVIIHMLAIGYVTGIGALIASGIKGVEEEVVVDSIEVNKLSDEVSWDTGYGIDGLWLKFAGGISVSEGNTFEDVIDAVGETVRANIIRNGAPRASINERNLTTKFIGEECDFSVAGIPLNAPHIGCEVEVFNSRGDTIIEMESEHTRQCVECKKGSLTYTDPLSKRTGKTSGRECYTCSEPLVLETPRVLEQKARTIKVKRVKWTKDETIEPKMSVSRPAWASFQRVSEHLWQCLLGATAWTLQEERASGWQRLCGTEIVKM